jgi:hypothetical protein
MLCTNCNQETNNKKFCSLSCSASTNNRLYPKKQKRPRKISQPKKSARKYNPTKRILKPFNNCLHCDKLTKRVSYCSNMCCSNNIFIKRVEEVDKLGYIYDSTKFNTSASFAKRYLKHKHGNYCSICKINSTWKNKPLILVLDHINGHSNDWSISNLRLVCPNCDSQLPTFKSKNKGNGRPRKS